MAEFLKQRSAAARLTEIEASIATLDKERAQHLERRPAEAVAKLTGDPAAGERLHALDAAVDAIDTRLRDLREAAAELRRRIAADEEAERRAQIEAKPKRIVELRHEYLKRVESVTDHAAAIAAELGALDIAAKALRDELDDVHAIRVLAPRARLSRLQSGLARTFVIDPSRSLTVENSLLGIACQEIGERSHMTPIDHETIALDDLAPFYETMAEAEAARDRAWSKTGPQPAIVPLPGLYALVRPERVFGDQAAAEREARVTRNASGAELVVLACDAAFVLIDGRFANGISAGTARAAAA